MTDSERFKDAVRHLHYEKDAAYGPSWKRRGEQISVLANIARKVDRLEQVAAGAPVTRDESLFDTTVDLLVYSFKYQTYLADLDAEVASRLFPDTPSPYSDGRDGFDARLGALDLTALDSNAPTPDIAAACSHAVEAFNNLEGSFAEPHTTLAPVVERLAHAIALTAAASEVVASLHDKAPSLYRGFLQSWGAA